MTFFHYDMVIYSFISLLFMEIGVWVCVGHRVLGIPKIYMLLIKDYLI